MAFAICVGAGTFAFLNLLVSPTLPLDDGDRVVAVRSWDVSENRAEPQVLHDRRPLAQVGLGVVVGAGLVAGLMLLGRGGALRRGRSPRSSCTPRS